MSKHTFSTWIICTYDWNSSKHPQLLKIIKVKPNHSIKVSSPLYSHTQQPTYSGLCFCHSRHPPSANDEHISKPYSGDPSCLCDTESTIVQHQYKTYNSNQSRSSINS